MIYASHHLIVALINKNLTNSVKKNQQHKIKQICKNLNHDKIIRFTLYS